MQETKSEAAEADEEEEDEDDDPPASAGLDLLPHAANVVAMAATPTIAADTRARCTEISHVNLCVWILFQRVSPRTRGQGRPLMFLMRPIRTS